MSENKEALKDMLKVHRSQFEQASTGQMWDILSTKL